MRIINLALEVTDEEFSNFLARASGGNFSNGSTGTGTDHDDNEPVNAAAPATDKNGVAWHEKYHSKSKALTADGVWRRARNLSEGDKLAAEAYEASAKNMSTVTPVVAAPVVAPVAVAPVVAPAAVVMPAIGLPAMGLPQPTAPVVAAPISVADVEAKFNEVHAVYPAILNEIHAIYAACGITDPNSLATDETLRRKLFDALNAKIPA